MRLFGHQVRITPYFWLIAILFAASQVKFSTTQDWQNDWILAALTIPIVFFALVWHELGHILCRRFFGARNLETVFGAYGGRSSSDGNIESTQRRVMIAMAGPIFTLILLFATLIVKRMIPGIDEPDMALVKGGLELLLTFNFVWTVANILPIFPMDCGLIINLLYPGGRVLQSVIGVILSAMAMVLGAITAKYGGSFVFAVLLYVNFRRLFMKELDES